MVGGDPEPFAKAEPVIACYARAVKLLGPSGAGQLTKMVNQICIAGLVQGLSEAIHFAQIAGLDVAAVMETLSKGAAQSWQMENRWKTMSEGTFDFGFAVDWMRKDLAICLDEARRNGAHLPVSALVDQFYSEVQAMGGRRWDTSSLIARLEPEMIELQSGASGPRLSPVIGAAQTMLMRFEHLPREIQRAGHHDAHRATSLWRLFANAASRLAAGLAAMPSR